MNTTRFIAHRGNISGPSMEFENTPAHIERAMRLDFMVEVDAWGVDKSIWFGHDAPQYPVSWSFIRENRSLMWFHCKNVQAIELLEEKIDTPHYFFHNTDDYTITSHGIIWCFPNKPLAKGVRSVVVLPEMFMSVPAIWSYLEESKAYGVCSDYVNDILLA